MNCSTQTRVTGFITFICVYIRNAFEYIYASIRHFLEVLAVFGTHISLKRTFDIFYLDICLPIYFFRGMETRGTKEMGKTKLSCKVKEKASITSYYLLLSDENIYVIGEESSSGNRSSGLVQVGGLLGL